MLEWTVPFILIYAIYFVFKDLIHYYLHEFNKKPEPPPEPELTTEEKREKFQREINNYFNYLISKERTSDTFKLQAYRENKSEYLKSPEWNEKRVNRLSIDNYKCQQCNTMGVILHVHHKTYANLYDEHENDLISLCADCHKQTHEQLGYPCSIKDYNTKYYWHV